MIRRMVEILQVLNKMYKVNIKVVTLIVLRTYSEPETAINDLRSCILLYRICEETLALCPIL